VTNYRVVGVLPAMKPNGSSWTLRTNSVGIQDRLPFAVHAEFDAFGDRREADHVPFALDPYRPMPSISP